MDDITHVLSAFGPTFALGLVAATLMTLIGTYMPFASKLQKIVLVFFVLAPPLFVLMILSVRAIRSYDTSIPEGTGGAFFVLGVLCGLYLTDLWRTRR